MPVAAFCFVTATLAALTGMVLGLWMGAHEDFTLAPAHAHLNLLGWVTLSLYGLYHRGIDRGQTRVVWVQVGAGAAGAVLMAGGLGLMLGRESPAAAPMILAGSFLALGSMVLFLAIVLVDAARPGLSGIAPLRERGHGW